MNHGQIEEVLMQEDRHERVINREAIRIVGVNLEEVLMNETISFDPMIVMTMIRTMAKREISGHGEIQMEMVPHHQERCNSPVLQCVVNYLRSFLTWNDNINKFLILGGRGGFNNFGSKFFNIRSSSLIRIESFCCRQVAAALVIITVRFF